MYKIDWNDLFVFMNKDECNTKRNYITADNNYNFLKTRKIDIARVKMKLDKLITAANTKIGFRLLEYLGLAQLSSYLWHHEELQIK